MASPTMMSATSILKRPEARISKITEDITLPRSISVKSFIAGIIGFIFAFKYYRLSIIYIILVEILLYHYKASMLQMSICRLVPVCN